MHAEYLQLVADQLAAGAEQQDEELQNVGWRRGFEKGLVDDPGLVSPRAKDEKRA